MERRSRTRKHWIQFELKDFYLIGRNPLSAETFGGTNGIITEYKVEVSNDGVHFEEAATGTWDANAAWKLASFEPVCAKYVRLTSLDALSWKRIMTMLRQRKSALQE